MLKHITILSRDGITIYHKSFIASDLDDVLFSALSGAIIAFSKELGDELQSIIMKKSMIFFKNKDENIIIFSFDSSGPLNQHQIEFKLNQAIDYEEFSLICANTFATQEIDERLSDSMISLFDLNEDIKKKLREQAKNEISLDELTGESFLDALNRLDSI